MKLKVYKYMKTKKEYKQLKKYKIIVVDEVTGEMYIKKC